MCTPHILLDLKELEWSRSLLPKPSTEFIKPGRFRFLHAWFLSRDGWRASSEMAGGSAKSGSVGSADGTKSWEVDVG